MALESREGKESAINVYYLILLVICAVTSFCAVRHIHDIVRRHETYQLSRVILSGLANYSTSSNGHHGYPAVRQQGDSCASWKTSVLEYLVEKEGFDKPAIINAINGGGRKCTVFAIIDRNGDWLSHGIQPEEASELERPLLAIILQDKFAWDECVEACIASPDEMNLCPKDVFISTAIFLDSRRFVWSSDDSRLPRHFVFRKSKGSIGHK